MKKASYCLFCGKYLSKFKKNLCCDSCYEKIRKNKRKLLKLMAIKHKGGRCCICGYNKSIQALTFHHINPNNKKFNITNFLKQKDLDMDELYKELDKTICVCKNCHSEINSGIITDKKIKKVIGKENFIKSQNTT